jgi:hypothetical protein
LIVDTALYGAGFVNRMPCNSYYHISDLNKCTAGAVSGSFWCLSVIFSLIQTIIRPLLDESIERSVFHKRTELIAPLDARKINIVWHVRTGDLCFRCENTAYFENIYKFIADGLAGLPHQNIVAHLPEKRVAERFQNITYTEFSGNNIEDVVQLFMQADIFIATGSSFSAEIALFAKLFRPLVFISVDKDASGMMGSRKRTLEYSC